MAILLISIAMLAPIGAAAVSMFDGRTVAQAAWSVPLAILGTGWVLTWLLTRKQIPLQLYILAFALWILTAGYFFARFVRLS
jgi:hypothetical protein